MQLVVRIFFRRVGAVGAANVPPTGPLLIAVNHPNALIDPLVLLALTPRRVVFLAKEPLFRMPVIGWLARAAGSIPVYRRQDGADAALNRRTFDLVGTVLARGGAIAVFPEGTSHSDPRQRAFKTGTARMALSAASGGPRASCVIVPCGIYYTAKVTFRSSALLVFGAPLAVLSCALDDAGEPDAESVHALNHRIEDALRAVTLQADEHEAIRLVTRAERIFSSVTETMAPDRDLARQFELRQRLLAGYTHARERAPARLAMIERMIMECDSALTAAGLAPESIVTATLPAARVLWNALAAAVLLLLLAPFALSGMIAGWPAYRLIDPLVHRLVAPERDLIATAKVLVGAAVFTVEWLAVGVLAWLRWGAVAGGAALVALPICGYAALIFSERADRLAGAARGLSLKLLRPAAFRSLETQRRRIRQEILELAALVEPT